MADELTDEPVVVSSAADVLAEVAAEEATGTPAEVEVTPPEIDEQPSAAAPARAATATAFHAHEWAGKAARYRVRLTREELEFVQRRLPATGSASGPSLYSVKMLHRSAENTSTFSSARLSFLYLALFMLAGSFAPRPVHSAWALAAIALGHGGHLLLGVLLNARLRAYALRRDLLLGRRTSGAESLLDYPHVLRLHADSGAALLSAGLLLGFYAVLLFADTTESASSWQAVATLVILFFVELGTLALKGAAVQRALVLLAAVIERLEDAQFEENSGVADADAAAGAGASADDEKAGAAPAPSLAERRSISDELLAVLVYDGYRAVLRDHTDAVVPEEDAQGDEERVLVAEQERERERLRRRRWKVVQMEPRREWDYASHAMQAQFEPYFRSAVREGRHPRPTNQANPFRIRLSHPSAHGSTVYAAMQQLYLVALTVTLLIATSHAPWHTVAALVCHMAVWLSHTWLETQMNRSLRQYRFRWAYLRRPDESLVREMLPYKLELRFWMTPGAAIFTHLFFFVIFSMYVYLAPQHHRSLQGALGGLMLACMELFVIYSMRHEALTIHRVFEYITQAQCPDDEVEDELMALLLNDEAHDQLLGSITGRDRLPARPEPKAAGRRPPVAWTDQADREHMRTLWACARDGAVWSHAACANCCTAASGAATRRLGGGGGRADHDEENPAGAADAPPAASAAVSSPPKKSGVTRSASRDPQRLVEEEV